jgi:enoyl-CoA hydratase
VDPTSYEFLSIDIGTDGVALVVLDRPEKLNACRASDHRELARVLREIATDDRISVAVFTGRGRAFSVGGDYTMVEETASVPGARLTIMDDARELVHAHLDLDKPVIAAVNGIASGAGAAFALLCDFVIADRSARLADAHVIAGLAAGDGGVIAWPLSAGLIRAKRYLLTGDFIPAEEAERIGLITEVVDDGNCVETSMALARRLAETSHVAVRYTKRALNQLMRDTGIRSFELSLALEMLAKDTGETLLAVQRWKAGQKPRHSGIANS